MSTDDDEDARPLRYFTPAEANAVLPEVQKHMRRIVERVDRARTLAETLRDGQPPSDRERAMDELDGIRDEIEAEVEAIHAHGVEVKGLSPRVRIHSPSPHV